MLGISNFYSLAHPLKSYEKMEGLSRGGKGTGKPAPKKSHFTKRERARMYHNSIRPVSIIIKDESHILVENANATLQNGKLNWQHVKDIVYPKIKKKLNKVVIDCTMTYSSNDNVIILENIKYKED